MIDPEALQATVDRYNALCAKGSDDDFHKEASHMVPINGPYYILRLPQICTDGYTGAKINTNAQVIGKNGQPIPGLYACGSIDDRDLEKAAPETTKEKAPKATIRRTRSDGMTPTLDLRGHRYEEAMAEVDRYIDSALLAGYPTVTIDPLTDGDKPNGRWRHLLRVLIINLSF